MEEHLIKKKSSKSLARKTSKESKGKSANKAEGTSNSVKEIYKVLVKNENELLKQTNHYSNRIESSKYTWLNLVPKIIIEQFSNVGNIYFLILAILQLIPSISNSGSTPINFVPLAIVVIVNGIKDAVEDYKRKKADTAENNTKVQLFQEKISSRITMKSPNGVSSEGFFESKWESIKPGDLVKINKGESFPADLCLLYSPNPKGAAFVETKSLDGETNLKLKESIKCTYNIINNLQPSTQNTSVISDSNTVYDFFKNLQGEINADEPNDRMYEFSANIKLYNSKQSKPTQSELERIDEEAEDENAKNLRTSRIESEDAETFKKSLTSITNFSETTVLDYNNLLLRGSILMQTEYVYGIVVYAGHSTKIMLNSISARSKSSKLAKMMNLFLTKVLVIQGMICLFCTIFNMSEKVNINFYGDSVENGFLRACISFMIWFLTIQNIIPISLIVTLEMIKFCQALFINWDIKLYHFPTKSSCIVQSSSLNEELGQISHIFTDKTGTLTKNYMQFKCLLVKNKKYGSAIIENEEEIEGAIHHKSSKSVNEDSAQELEKIPHVSFHDKYFWNDWKTDEEGNITNMVLSLALCHTSVSEPNKDVQRESDADAPIIDLNYQASSPDELAVVYAAKYFGYVFLERKDDNIIEIYNKKKHQTLRFRLLKIFEFNSDRKRMSIIVKDENGKMMIITKGADTVITKRMNKDLENHEDTIMHIQQHLNDFGHVGLRTLLFASREISEIEYASFIDAYNAAINITDSTRQSRIEETYDLLESQLNYLGATAIEDQLQDDLSKH